MGINGLLKLVEAARTRAHVSAYAGKRVAVDAYVWLHKGVYSCSTELALGVPTDRWLSYCLKKVDVLRHNNVVPVMVFDGGHLPVKRGVELDRRARREEARKRGLELYRQENYRDADNEFVKAVEITTEMAVKLIRQLQAGGIECIIAPYEADAQLAYLALTGYVHAVITEDSDLLAFGAPRVMFKMEKTGDGDEITRDAIWGLANPSFANWTPAMFRHMCILMGCDYTPSIGGLGPKKALALIGKWRDVDRVLAAIKLDTKAFTMPSDYDERFRQADLTFQHQRVYDPSLQRMVTLTPLPEQLEGQMLDFLGPPLPPDVCHAIATAQLDPYTKQPYTTPPPPPAAASPDDAAIKRSASVPTFGSRKRVKAEKPAFPVQRNKVTHYFAVTARASQQFRPPRPLGAASSAAEEAAAKDKKKSKEEEEEEDDMVVSTPALLNSVDSIPDSPDSNRSSCGRHENSGSDVEIIDAPLSDTGPRPPPLVPATPPAKLAVSRFFTQQPGGAAMPSPVARNLTLELMGEENMVAAAPPPPKTSPKAAFVSPNVTANRLSLAHRPAPLVMSAAAPKAKLFSPYFSSQRQPPPRAGNKSG